MDEMRTGGLVTDVDSDYQVGMPEVRVIPDRNKAADLGISMRTIGETINAAIGGERAGKFKEGGRRYDIRVRLLAQQRQRPEDIQRLFVRTGTGDLVRLGDLVTIVQEPTLQAITRKDRAARHHHLRERGAGRVAGGRAGRTRATSRRACCPTATGRCRPAPARPSRSRSRRWCSRSGWA